MATQGSRATYGDSPQHLELLVAQPGAVLFPEAVSPGRRMSATSTAGRTI